MRKLMDIVTEIIVWFLVTVIIVGLLPWGICAAAKNKGNPIIEELKVLELLEYKLKHMDK